MTNYPPAPRPGGSGEGNEDNNGAPYSGLSGNQSPPTCPRHPERVSYVRCQRCERPVCPECQRQAAVGVQCVDCVRESKRQTPQARTVLGGRVSGGRPVVTLTLIGINVAIFLLGFVTPIIQDLLIFWPAVGPFEPYRAITSGFLHGGTLH